MDFEQSLRKKTAYVQDVVSAYLPQEGGYEKKLAEAMRYSLLAGGKRIRPLLLYESCLIHGADPETAKPFMAAIEMIHTHSLIHDDLPALDNDDLRRGKPTSHVVFGEAGAILAGDALLNLAYETILSGFADGYEADRLPVPARCGVAREVAADHLARRWRALRILAEKTGIHGMLGGQSVDVENDRRSNVTPDRPMLEYIYEAKTAALLEAPLMIGAVLGGADPDEIARMEKAGSRIGAAFQIRDDILDLTASEKVLGKPAASDIDNGKCTFVTLLGMEACGRTELLPEISEDDPKKQAAAADTTELSRAGISAAEEQVRVLTEEALSLLKEVPGDTAFLEELICRMALRKS